MVRQLVVPFKAFVRKDGEDRAHRRGGYLAGIAAEIPALRQSDGHIQGVVLDLYFGAAGA